MNVYAGGTVFVYMTEHEVFSGKREGKTEEELDPGYTVNHAYIKLSVSVGCVWTEFEPAAFKGFVHECGKEYLLKGDLLTAVVL